MNCVDAALNSPSNVCLRNTTASSSCENSCVMMSYVHMRGVRVLETSTPFDAPFKFEVLFKCNKALKHDLEYKVIYVGCASNKDYDQELDSVLVGPVQVGESKFIMDTGTPDINKIPKDELIGLTVLLIKCLYGHHEFARIGYFVTNEFKHSGAPTRNLCPQHIRRTISPKPWLTYFPIDWVKLNK